MVCEEVIQVWLSFDGVYRLRSMTILVKPSRPALASLSGIPHDRMASRACEACTSANPIERPIPSDLLTHS